jgi:hypothetical protein
MIARMTGRAPLLLAAVLFGAGVTGLAISTAERTEWGPFQPRSQAPVPRVVVVDVGPEITPPPLHELFTGYPSGVAAETAAQVQAPAPAGETPEPEPTPVPPLRVYGIASDDASVSAAGATPTPPPPVRIINIAADVEPAPTPEATPAEQSEQQPQSGCDLAGCPGGAGPGSGESAPERRWQAIAGARSPGTPSASSVAPRPAMTASPGRIGATGDGPGADASGPQ